MPSATVWADCRYQGNHGIARYGREVLTRVHGWSPLPVTGNPTAPTSVLRTGWWRPGKADLIYSPGFGTGYSRSRQLLTVHDLIHFETATGPKGAAQRAYFEGPVRRAIKKTGHVLTVSGTSQTAIKSWLGDPSIQVHNTGNGCSSEFTTSGPRHRRVRPYVVFVGGVKRHKNVQVLFRSLRVANDVDLVIVTSSPNEMLELAAEHGVGERVTCVSALSDRELAAYYRGAAAVAVTSIVEGFGLPAVESLRCGTPVIFYEGCESVAEICQGTQIGVDNADDPAAWATGIMRALDETFIEPDLTAYTWEAVADRVVGVIAQLTSEGAT